MYKVLVNATVEVQIYNETFDEEEIEMKALKRISSVINVVDFYDVLIEEKEWKEH